MGDRVFPPSALIKDFSLTKARLKCMSLAVQSPVTEKLR
jgi:hypothetical protein